jgi:hypothetical protein
VGFEFARGMREKVRGVYGFKLSYEAKKKLKTTLSFASPEKEIFFLIFMM